MTLSDRTPSARRGLAVSAVALALMAAACTGGAVPTTASPVAVSSPSITPTAAADPSSSPSSTAPSLQPSARAESTPIPIWTGPQDRVPGAPGQCDAPGRPCQFTAGTYQTYGRWAFLPGLTMSIPDGWNSTEQDAGEFNLHNPDFPDGNGLFFWRDVIPVEPDGTHITTVPSTVAGITNWLRADHRLGYPSRGRWSSARVWTPRRSWSTWPDGSVNKDHECAEIGVKATCFPILTDPAHWGDGAWTVASTESCRYYLATIGPASNRHLMIVAVAGRTPLSGHGSRKPSRRSSTASMSAA